MAPLVGLGASGHSPAGRKDFHRRWQSQQRPGLKLSALHLVAGALGLGLVLLVAESYWLARTRGPAGGVEDYAHQDIEENGLVYPEALFTSEWAEPVPDADLLHLGLLHEACLHYKDSVIPWTYGHGGRADGATATLINRDDPELLAKMRQCPEVDIFLPLGIRGHGYCEDSIAYTKYLQSRMLPAWAIEMQYVDAKTGRTYSYHDLCPKTPMIFLNHYWDGIPDKPEWPKDKPMYLMPNIEMYELEAKHYWGVNAVLCKTAICARRVRMWYQQEGNPKKSTVWYTRHTSSDIAALARARLGPGQIQPKNFSDVRFVHAVGTSVQKGTRPVLDCWLRRPDFPKLDIYMNEDIYNGEFKGTYDEDIKATNGQITMHLGRVGANDFGKMIAEAAFFLCTSVHEGYGHYINQARATGAVIITTDLPPMNEFLDDKSGIMAPVTRWAMKQQMLGGRYDKEHGLRDVEGLTGRLIHQDVCAAVEKVLAMTPAERELMASRARTQYHIDTRFFEQRMKDLQGHARSRRSVRSP